MVDRIRSDGRLLIKQEQYLVLGTVRIGKLVTTGLGLGARLEREGTYRQRRDMMGIATEQTRSKRKNIKIFSTQK